MFIKNALVKKCMNVFMKAVYVEEVEKTLKYFVCGLKKAVLSKLRKKHFLAVNHCGRLLHFQKTSTLQKIRLRDAQENWYSYVLKTLP